MAPENILKLMQVFFISSIMEHPKVAVINEDTLALIGMKTLLEQVMPIMETHTFNSLEELQRSDEGGFVHSFVSQAVLLNNRDYFVQRRHQTIVFTPTEDAAAQPSGFHCICCHQSEKLLVRQLLALEQYAHGHGQHLPVQSAPAIEKKLSKREIDVLRLIVKGYINKEIADKLNIGLTTVITHRKNIVAKLGRRSVSALTIYAVMHGYVDVNSI